MIGFLQYLGIIIVSYLGVVVGTILSYIAPEELTAGKKYFILLEKIFIVLLIFFIFHILKFPFLASFFIALICFLMIFSLKANIFSKIFSDIYVIIAFGFIIYFGYRTISSLFFIALIIFLYNLFSAALFIARNQELLRDKFNLISNMLMRYEWYVLVALLLYLIGGFF